MENVFRETNRKKSLAFAGFSVLLWSTVATAFKLGLRELDFIQLIFIASGVSTLFFLVYLIVTQQFNIVLHSTGKDLLHSAILGALNPFAYYLILFKSYDLLPAQLAQPLNMIWPFTLAILSVFLLKQKITWQQFSALGISLAGIVVLSSQGSLNGFKQTNIWGVLLATGSSIFWALYWIFNVKDSRPEAVKLFLNFLSGFIYLLILLHFTSGFRFPPGISFQAAIYTGLFETGITYLLWMKAMQLTDNNAITGSLIYAAPFLSLFFISSIIGEKIHVTTIIGLIMIVIGIMYLQIRRKNAT
jgi:drug/metabolite transporter (DMT)-like permease